jgi:hypothetical protein
MLPTGCKDFTTAQKKREMNRYLHLQGQAEQQTRRLFRRQHVLGIARSGEPFLWILNKPDVAAEAWLHLYSFFGGQVLSNQFVEFLLRYASCKNDPVFKTFSLPTNLQRVELFCR